MAYTSSGELPVGSSYTLGNYVFSLTATPDPGEGTTGINVRCDKGSERARAASEVSGTVESWSVEANETVASVYVNYKDREKDEKKSEFNLSPIVQPVPVGASYKFSEYGGQEYDLAGSKVAYYDYIDGPNVMYYDNDNTWETIIVASGSASGTYHRHKRSGNRSNEFEGDFNLPSSYSYDGKTVYYASFKEVNEHYMERYGKPPILFSGAKASTSGRGYANSALVAWTMVYGAPAGDFGDEKGTLVARFAINLGDAGGYPGGGGGWTQPGDWNPTPTTTLQMAVSGALSGRHNDPLHDTSYSYLPADNMAEAGYGCGGDGGHGGGGGAGASTVIVRQFATNKANNKDIIALAKRHGYGSGGGKGAKGGDGCILIYY